MIKVEWAIDPNTSQRFHCVFNTATCLPIEPIQRFLNHCRQRGLADNTISTYAYRLVDFWRWLEQQALNWTEVDLEKLADFVHWYLMGGNVEVISEDVRETMSQRSARTVNQTVTAIQEFYAHHVLEGRVDEKRLTKLVPSRRKRGGFLKGIVWYIKFFQHKTQRWHQIPADRQIRRVIEEQQQWIRETLGSDYSYLFCHFRSFNKNSYPYFSSIKPLPQPPKVRAASNPMVRIIRMLIDQENIRDANGQKPHFTGKITRPSRLQEIRIKHGIEAAQLYADHQQSSTTFQYYTPPTREEVAKVDLPFQELLMNPENKFIPSMNDNMPGNSNECKKLKAQGQNWLIKRLNQPLRRWITGCRI